MVFSSIKVANFGQQGKRTLLFICIWLDQVNHHSDSSAMTDYRCKFWTLGRHRILNQFRQPNMSAHLTIETSYWRKKLLMHWNWAIYNVCDLNIAPHVCFSRPCHRIGLGQPRLHSQRSVRDAARDLYALAHHTEAETATQGVNHWLKV